MTHRLVMACVLALAACGWRDEMFVLERSGSHPDATHTGGTTAGAPGAAAGAPSSGVTGGAASGGQDGGSTSAGGSGGATEPGSTGGADPGGSASTAAGHDGGGLGGTASWAGSSGSAGAPPALPVTDHHTKGFCLEDGWCWVRPWPQGNSLAAAAVDGEGRLWAAGDGGTLLSTDGETFQQYLTRRAENFTVLSLAPDGHAWIGGYDGVVLEYDGERFADHSVGPEMGIVQGLYAASDEVWLATYQGFRVFRDGVWETAGPDDGMSARRDVHGTGANDIHVLVGATVYRQDGADWEAVGTGDFFRIHVVPGGFVAQHTPRGTAQDAGVTLCDAEGCTTHVIRPGHKRAFAARSLDDVWIAGYQEALHWDGWQWNSTPMSFEARALAHGDGGVVWAVGDNGAVARLSSEEPEPQWELLTEPPTNGYSCVWGNGRNDVWFGGRYGVALHYDGHSLSEVSTDESWGFERMAGSGPDDVWGVGSQGTLAHWDGVRWTNIEPGTPGSPLSERPEYPDELHFHAVWSFSPNDVWVFGSWGITWHFDGSTWSGYDSDLTSVYSAFALGPDELWASDYAGGVSRFDGMSWASIGGDAVFNLNDIWASAVDDVWAVGGLDGREIGRYSGQTWSGESDQDGAELSALWGFSSDDVWMVGGSGPIIHWDGQAYRESADPGVALEDIWGAESADVWAVGLGGVILRRRQGEWDAGGGGGTGGSAGVATGGTAGAFGTASGGASASTGSSGAAGAAGTAGAEPTEPLLYYDVWFEESAAACATHSSGAHYTLAAQENSTRWLLTGDGRPEYFILLAENGDALELEDGPYGIWQGETLESVQIPIESAGPASEGLALVSCPDGETAELALRIGPDTTAPVVRIAQDMDLGDIHLAFRPIVVEYSETLDHEYATLLPVSLLDAATAEPVDVSRDLYWSLTSFRPAGALAFEAESVRLRLDQWLADPAGNSARVDPTAVTLHDVGPARELFDFEEGCPPGVIGPDARCVAAGEPNSPCEASACAVLGPVALECGSAPTSVLAFTLSMTQTDRVRLRYRFESTQNGAGPFAVHQHGLWGYMEIGPGGSESWTLVSAADEEPLYTTPWQVTELPAFGQIDDALGIALAPECADNPVPVRLILESVEVVPEAVASP